MISDRTLGEKIALVERKLEIRRLRAARSWQDAKIDVARGTKWVPLAAVVAVGAVAFALGHRGGDKHKSIVTRSPVATAGLFATLATLGGPLVRIALSPQARGIWHAWRSRPVRR